MEQAVHVLATIPYFSVPVYNVGAIPLDPWALLVCIGFIVGMEVCRARGIRLGLDVRDVIDGILVIVGMGFVGGHLVHVLAYHPSQLAADGVMSLLRIWGGFSSFGGFLGAVAGVVLFYKVIRKRPFWIHTDNVMFGFPFAWFFGRLGCFSVHDHIGRPSHFFLAMDFPSLGGPRHELGLYEALWTLAIAATFFLLRDKSVRPGTFCALWCLMYAPVRFFFDFLRSTDLEQSDVRWAGLTPAQYGCVLMAATGVALVLWLRKQPVAVQGQDSGN
jgi:phosphatidylglycerol---prolipoprotein diacylglyceryl transferase